MTSLKALGASLIAAALVVFGAAIPSQAAASVTMVTNPTPTFTASSNSPAFTLAIDNNGTFNADGAGTQLQFDVRSNNGVGGMWFPVNGCETSYVNVSASHCGIDSVTATSGLGTPEVKNNAGTLYFKGLGTATSVTIAFADGAFTTAAGSGLFNMKATTGSIGQTSYQLQVTVLASAPSYIATFSANGGTGTPMASINSSTGSVTMPANTYTKSGYSFSGWRANVPSAGTIYPAGTSAPLTSGTVFYAQWTANGSGGGGGSSSSANLTMGASTGQLVAGSSVAVAASGLQTTAPYTVVVQSTPQTIGSGNATAGAVNTSVVLPSGLEAGWHTLTFSSTGSDGSAVTSVLYFQVSASGTLLATTSTIPAELANTGFNAAPYLSTGAVLALAGVVLMLFARRRQTS